MYGINCSFHHYYSKKRVLIHVASVNQVCIDEKQALVIKGNNLRHWSSLFWIFDEVIELRYVSFSWFCLPFLVRSSLLDCIYYNCMERISEWNRRVVLDINVDSVSCISGVPSSTFSRNDILDLFSFLDGLKKVHGDDDESIMLLVITARRTELTFLCLVQKALCFCYWPVSSLHRCRCSMFPGPESLPVMQTKNKG